MGLYRSPECIGYADLEQTLKYMTICCIGFYPCRSVTKQIWPCYENGHGQHSVIIWTNLVVPQYLMLYTKLQSLWPRLVPKKEIFEGFLTYMGLEALLVMWHGTFEQIFIPISHGGSIWNLASIGLCVLSKCGLKMLNLSDLGQRSLNDTDLWYS